jgi:hypothetical protein
MRAVLLMPVLLTLGACGPATPSPPGMGSIELGTTALDGTGFDPLVGDQPLVPGAQGGFHVWLKYRVGGMSPGKVTVYRTVRRVSDDKLILRAEGAVELGEPGDDGMWELPAALPSFMCPTPIGVQVEDEPVVFDVQVKDAGGTLLGEGTAEATPRCPTDAQADFCHRICDG